MAIPSGIFSGHDGLSSPVICLSVDVEWAVSEVLADLVFQLDERGLTATFFCTHDGIELPGHERGLHPNFRRTGQTMQGYRGSATDEDVLRHVVQSTRAFCPEAVGVRAHSMFCDTAVLPIYRDFGLQYDSSYALPLARGLQPTRIAYDIVELPVYYMDHLDLIEDLSGFELSALGLDEPGLKVLDFHPNMVFTNAPTEAHYQDSKRHYSDPQALLEMRHRGRGIRDLFLDVLDFVATRQLPLATLGEVNAAWREQGN